MDDGRGTGVRDLLRAGQPEHTAGGGVSGGAPGAAVARLGRPATAAVGAPHRAVEQGHWSAAGWGGGRGTVRE